MGPTIAVNDGAHVKTDGAYFDGNGDDVSIGSFDYYGSGIFTNELPLIDIGASCSFNSKEMIGKLGEGDLIHMPLTVLLGDGSQSNTIQGRESSTLQEASEIDHMVWQVC